MSRTMDELHAEWKDLEAQKRQLVARQAEIKEAILTAQVDLADITEQLQKIEESRMELVPKMAEAAIAAGGVSNADDDGDDAPNSPVSTKAGASQKAPLMYMR